MRESHAPATAVDFNHQILFWAELLKSIALNKFRVSGFQSEEEEEEEQRVEVRAQTNQRQPPPSFCHRRLLLRLENKQNKAKVATVSESSSSRLGAK